MVHACMGCKLTPILIGPAGSGKTELVKQICVDINADLLHLYTAHLGAEEIKGLFFRSKDSHRTYSVLCNEEIYDAVEAAKEGRPLVIFLDELNRASDVDCLNALFSMISKRGIPGLEFPDNLYLIAAGNPPTGNFAVAEMADDAYIRRLVWFGTKVDAGTWLKYAQGKKSFKIPKKASLEAPERLPIHPQVISYIKSNPTRLFDEALADQAKPHPNPASWDRVSDIIKVLERDDEATAFNIKTILSGMVGRDIALNFWDFYSDGDLQISPEDLLELKWSHTLKKMKKLRDEGRHDIYSDLVVSVVLYIQTETPVLVERQLKNLVEFVCWIDEDQQALFGQKLEDMDKDSPEYAEWEVYKKGLMLSLQKFERFNDILRRLKQLNSMNEQ